MTMYFISTARLGLSVYPAMNITVKPLPESIRFGDGFTAYKTWALSATQFWAQITPETESQKKFVLISIGSRKYAELHPDQPETIDINPEFFLEMFQFMTTRGYTGVSPFYNKE